MSELVSLLIHSLFLMAILLFVLQGKRWGKYWPLSYVIAAVVVVMPWQHWLTLEFSRGYFSDLSLATGMMCLLSVFNVASKQPRGLGLAFYGFIALLGALFYPPSLGLGMMDPFSMGYRSGAYYEMLIMGFAALALVSWYKQYLAIAYLLTAALLFNGLNLYGSDNIWLYVIDPIIWITSLVVLLVAAIKAGMQKFKLVQGGNRVRQTT